MDPAHLRSDAERRYATIEQWRQGLDAWVVLSGRYRDKFLKREPNIDKDRLSQRFPQLA